MSLRSRVLRMLARRLRPDRGSVLVLTSVATVASLGAAAFAIDIGRGVAFKRELQADADLAALDAVRALGNRKGEDGLSPQPHTEKLAKQSLARNDFDISAPGNSWAVTLGVVDPETRVFSPADPSVATAVEVALTSPIGWAFQPGGQTYTARGVAEVNSPPPTYPDEPVLVDDSGSNCEGDGPLTIDILANDEDLGDAPSTVTLGALSPAAAGSVSLDGTNAIFTPAAGFTGVATFTYTVTDADGDADTATVTVSVAGSSNCPLPVPADDLGELCQPEPPITINILANDSGLQDTPVTVSLGAVSPVGAGSASLTADNHAVFTHSPSFDGVATFPYTVTDADGDTGSATVTVTVDATETCPGAVAGIALGSFLARVDTSAGLLNSLFSGYLQGSVTLVGYTGIAAGSVNLGQLRGELAFGTVEELLTTEITVRNFLLATVNVLQNKGDAASLQAASDLANLALAADSALTMRVGDIIRVAQGAQGEAASADLNALQLAMMAAQVANEQNFIDITLTTSNMGGGLAGLLSPLGGNTLRLRVIEPPRIAFGPVGTRVRTAQVRAQIHVRPLATLAGGVLDLPIYVEAASARARLESIDCQTPLDTSTVVVDTNTQAARAHVGEVADITAYGSVTVNKATILDLLLTDVTGRARVDLASGGDDLIFNGPFDWDNTQTVSATSLDLGNLLQAQPVSLTLLGLPVAGLLTDVLGVINPILSAVDEGLINDLLASLGVSVGGGDVTVWALNCNAGNPSLVG